MSDADNDAFSADTALEPYWRAAGEGRLLLSECRACGRTYYYPRPICPFCMSADTTWREASGAGTIYAWSCERRASPAYVIAFVTLAEGPTIMTSIVSCDPDAIAVGDTVKLLFEERDGQPVPVFAPAA